MSVPLTQDPTAKQTERSQVTPRPNPTDAMGIKAVNDPRAQRMELTTPDADWIKANERVDVTSSNEAPHSHKHHMPIHLHHKHKNVPEVHAVDMVDREVKPLPAVQEEKTSTSFKDKLKGIACIGKKHSDE